MDSSGKIIMGATLAVIAWTLYKYSVCKLEPMYHSPRIKNSRKANAVKIINTNY
jgi:hypothetical protein